jgi:hypothetical protein
MMELKSHRAPAPRAWQRRTSAKKSSTPVPAPVSTRLTGPKAQFGRTMLPLLAATTLEKIQAVPVKVWLNIGLGILIVTAALVIIRKAAEMNKVLLAVIVFVVFSSVGFNWIYARNEPRFMTPFIEVLAKFFPSADKQAEKEKRVITQ